MDVDLEIIDSVTYVYIVYKLYKFINEVANGTSRRWWVRLLNQSRTSEGFYEQSYHKIKQSDPEHFFKLTRMTVPTFNILLNLISSKLNKNSIRKPVEPECRLIITLLYVLHIN